MSEDHEGRKRKPPKKRSLVDFYGTPEGATKSLLTRVSISGSILECCDGAGAISSVLAAEEGISRIITNDLYPTREGKDFYLDATAPASWRSFPAVEWVVTNPPFALAPRIIPHALNHASVGIAMLLRLTYLEPCENRAGWLERNPPSNLIVLPRISFTMDGSTDNVTAAWMVWLRAKPASSIAIVPKPPKQAAQSQSLFPEEQIGNERNIYA